MKIAITGSSGLIGTALCEAILQRGDDPIRIVRSNPGPNDLVWDIEAGTIDTPRLEGVDAVVHLAGEGIAEKKWTPDQKAKIIESRRLGTALIAEAVAGLSTKPEVLVSGSAIGIYGDRGDEELTEQATPGSGFLTDVVGIWEAAAQPAVDAGIRTAFIRTGIVLSADGGALKEQLPFFKLGIGGRIGDGKQYWSWISITDQVKAILHIIDSNLAGPVNLTAPNPTTNSEFTKALGQALGRPTFLPTPKFAVDLRLGKEAAREFLFFSARVVPAALADSGFVFDHPTITEAFEALL
jgi:uncharacterized protein (TIGR01777 family)